MNVVFDHQIFYLQSFGGISRYYYELAAELSRIDGFIVSVIAPFHINAYLQHADHSFIRGPYFYRQFRAKGRICRGIQKLLLPHCYTLSGNADIVHETYYSMHSFGRGQFRILTVYDMIHELFASQFKDSKAVSDAKRAAVSRADHVLCISESTRQDLVRLFDVDRAKTSVVYLGHSLKGGKKKQIPRLNIDQPYLLYVGNRSGYKNFSLLCQAIASSPFLKKEFGLVAFGGGCFCNSERVLLKKLGLLEQVSQISGDDNLLEAFYRSASLFVYPSQYEGFGIPPLEAMSFDCPVACGNISSIPEVVGDAGIFFDPYSVDSMREAIEHAMNSSELRSELVSRGRRRHLAFSWMKCVNETAAIYKSITGGN